MTARTHIGQFETRISPDGERVAVIFSVEQARNIVTTEGGSWTLQPWVAIRQGIKGVLPPEPTAPDIEVTA